MKCGIMWSHIVLVSLALWQIGSCISIDNCPDNLEQNKYLKAFGDKCYFFYLFISREYNDAQGFCRQKGGNLVSIKSARMNSYLLDQLRNVYEYGGKIWIGLSDQADEKHYVWRDGSVMGYSNFESDTGPDTPWWDITDRVQDCVAMSPWSGEWEDLDCGDNIINDHHHAFVCEYDPKPKAPPPTTTTSTTTLPPTTADTTTTTIPPPPAATTTAPAPPPTTTIASTATPTTRELILPNEEGLMTTTTPTTTKTTAAFIVPTSDAAQPTTSTTLPPPTTTSTPLPPPTTTSTPLPPTTPTTPTPPPTTTSTPPPPPTTTSTPTPPPTTTSTPTPPPTTTSTPPPPTTTVKASTTSAPASSNDTSTAAATCPPIVCSKDCGMLGFATDKKTSCMMCECQEE